MQPRNRAATSSPASAPTGRDSSRGQQPAHRPKARRKRRRGVRSTAYPFPETVLQPPCRREGSGSAWPRCPAGDSLLLALRDAEEAGLPGEFRRAAVVAVVGADVVVVAVAGEDRTEVIPPVVPL